MAFRIDDDRYAKTPRRLDDGADDALGERALGIVGQHHSAGFRHGSLGMGDDRGLALRADGLCGLPIGPHQMGRMVFRNKAHLARGLTGVVDHEIGNNGAELGERFINGAAGFVVADKTDENALRPKSRDVARDIAGATDLHRVVPDAQHRRRRLRGNPRDVAVDEVVEHDVADAKNRLSGNEPQRLFKIKHCCARAAHALLLTDGDRRDRDIR